MFWKLRGKAFDEARGLETRQMHKSIVDSGVATGLLAYLHGEVVGWIAVEPRVACPVHFSHAARAKPLEHREAALAGLRLPDGHLPRDLDRVHHGFTFGLEGGDLTLLVDRLQPIANAEPIQELRNVLPGHVHDRLSVAVERLAFVRAGIVIGVDIDYEVIGKEGSMLMVTVSGTAVRLG